MQARIPKKPHETAEHDRIQKKRTVLLFTQGRVKKDSPTKKIALAITLQEVFMSNQKPVDSRVLYFDFLRVLACVAVITIHVAANEFKLIAVNSYEWMVFNVYDSLVRWGVPIFVMISGALFLAPERQLDIKRLYTKNLFRIVIAFIVWSAIYALRKYCQGLRLGSAVFVFFKGGNHLWFLYMIAGLYLATPVLRKITESRKITQYFLILWLFFSVALPTVRGLLLLSDKIFFFSDWVDVFSDNINLKLVCGYTGYYVLGHWLHQNELSKKQRGIIFGLGVFGAGMIIVLTYLISLKQKQLEESFYEYLTVFVLCEAVSIFVFFKYHSPQLSDGFSRKLLLTTSKCSFGIYLVHFWLATNPRPVFRMDTLTINPVFSVPLLTAAVFVCSFAISYILNKIPFINKYIV